MAADWNYDQAIIDGRSPSLDLSDPNALYDHGTLTPYSGSYPLGATDHLFVLGGTMPTSNTVFTALLLFDSSGANTGTSIAAAVTVSITATDVTVGVSGDNTSDHRYGGDFTGAGVAYGAGGFYPAVSIAGGGSINLHDTARLVLSSSINVTLTGSLTTSAGTTITNASGVGTTTITVGGNVSLTGTTLDGDGGETISLAVTGNITLASIAYNFGTNLRTTGCVNFSATGSTVWTGALPTSGSITGNISFGSGTSLVASGATSVVAGGSFTFAGTADASGGAINLNWDGGLLGAAMNFSGTVTGGTVTLNGSSSPANVTAVTYGSGGILAVSNVNSLTVTGSSVINGNITGGAISFGSGTTYDTGAASVSITAGSITMTSCTILSSGFGTGSATMSATGNITFSNVTLTISSGDYVAISAAVDVSITGGSVWIGSLTCSGDLTLGQTGTGPFAVGGDIVISAGGGGGTSRLVGGSLVG